MRWKAFISLSRDTEDERDSNDDHYGFNSQKHPSQVKELIGFKADLLKVIENVEFKCRDLNSFQKTLRSDMQRIKKSNAVFVPSDKTIARNLYEMEIDHYEVLRDNVTKRYKHAPMGTHNNVNTTARRIASTLGEADRMEPLTKTIRLLRYKTTRTTLPTVHLPD